MKKVKELKRKPIKGNNDPDCLVLWKVYNSNDKRTLEYKRTFTQSYELEKFCDSLLTNEDVIEIALYTKVAVQYFERS